MARAGDRCEAPAFLVWGRCHGRATDADHVYPWSRAGRLSCPTGQALCRAHNRGKSNLRPPWWYVLSLERRRARYFPVGTDVRVRARMSTDEQSARVARGQRTRR